MKKKSLLFLLTALFVACLLFACSEPNPRRLPEEPHTHPTVWYEELNYSGTTVKISLPAYTPEGKDIPPSAAYIKGSDDRYSDDVRLVAYNANRDAEDAFGVKIEYVEYTGSAADTKTYIEDAVLAASDSTPDLFIGDLRGLLRAGQSDSLYNVRRQDETNHLSFKKEDGWYTDLMDSFSLDPDATYILAGDYFIDVLRKTHVLLLNVERYEELVGDLEANLYADILAGLWDYDYFTELTALAWEPKRTNTGSAKPDDHVIGFVYDEKAVAAFLHGTDEPLPTRNTDGTLSLPYENDGFFAVADELFDLLTAPQAYSVNEGNSVVSQFVEGNALLVGGLCFSDLELQAVRGFEDRKAAIVYPKADGDAAYRSAIDLSAEVGGIAACTEKLPAITAVLQYLTLERGEKIRKEYMQYAARFTYRNNYVIGQMMNLIYKSISAPSEVLLDCAISREIDLPSELLYRAARARSKTYRQHYKDLHSTYLSALQSLK